MNRILSLPALVAAVALAGCSSSPPTTDAASSTEVAAVRAMADVASTAPAPTPPPWNEAWRIVQSATTKGPFVRVLYREPHRQDADVFGRAPLPLSGKERSRVGVIERVECERQMIVRLRTHDSRRLVLTVAEEGSGTLREEPGPRGSGPSLDPSQEGELRLEVPVTATVMTTRQRSQVLTADSISKPRLGHNDTGGVFVDAHVGCGDTPDGRSTWFRTLRPQTLEP